MAGAFSYAKVVSNTVVLKLDADDKFLDYLKNSVKNNFSSSIILRRSIFIFSRENERHRRKIFLTWAANLFAKELIPFKHSLLTTMLNSCDLPINIQISSKNQMVALKKIYVYFAKDAVSIKCFSKQATIFSYIKALLRSESDMEESLYELKISNMSFTAKQRLKNALSKKLFLGLDTFEGFYSKAEFDRFFSQSGYTYVKKESAEEQRKIQMLSVLGIKEDVGSIDTLKKRYYELAKTYHPDLHSEKSESERAHMSLQFLKVKEAYETLRHYVA
jgi:molecular chaperone DnaJ